MKRYAQLIKYGITGVLTTGVNYTLYFALTAAAGKEALGGRFYLLANAAAWLGAVIFSYAVNRNLVFGSQKNIRQEFLQFAGLRLATLAVEELLLYLLVELLLGAAGLFSKLAVSVITVIANYAACKCSIFAQKGA